MNNLIDRFHIYNKETNSIDWDDVNALRTSYLCGVWINKAGF